MRNTHIDTLRGLAILLMLYGHAMELSFLVHPEVRGLWFLQWKFIYSFHLPIFYFVSGMLYSGRDTRRVIKGSLCMILMAVVCHLLITLSAQALAGHFSLRDLFYPVVKLAAFQPVVVWFLVSLALVQLVFHGLRELRRPALRVLLLATAVVASVVCIRHGSRFLQLQALLPGLFFYWTGQAFAGSRWREHLAGLSAPNLAVICLLLLPATFALAHLNQGCHFNPVAQCFNLPDRFTVLFVFGDYGFIPVFILAALSGILLTYLGVMLLSRLLPGSRPQQFLTRIGESTMGLLIVSGLFIDFVQPQLVLHGLVPSSAPAIVTIILGLLGLQLLLRDWSDRVFATLFAHLQRFSDWLVARLVVPARCVAGASEPANITS